MKDSFSLLWVQFRKRPILVLLIGYLVFLFGILKIEPSLYEELYGFSRREAMLKEVLAEEVTIDGILWSLKSSAYGKSATLIGTLPIEEAPVSRIKVVVYLPKDTTLSPGDRVEIQGTFSFPRRASNPGEWDQQYYCRLHRIDGYLRPIEIRRLDTGRIRSVFFSVWCSRDAVASRIKALWKEPYSGLVAAMLTGNDSLMEEEERDLFASAGISHVIAISGLHLSVIVQLIERWMKKEMLSRRRRNVMDILIWVYALWTGGSVATVRAAGMLSVKHRAYFVSRKVDATTMLSLVVLVQLLINPLLLLTPQFCLSYGAYLGMSLGKAILLRPRRHLKTPILPFFLFQKMAASLGISILTYPIVRRFFYQASILGFLLNLWVIPLMGILLPLAIDALLLSLIYLPLGAGFAWLVEGALKLMETGSRWLIRLEVLVLPKAWRLGTMENYEVLLFYGVLILLWLCLRERSFRRSMKEPRKILQLGVLALMTLFLLLPSHEWRVAYLDVGQGDACVIEWEGKVILVDAGPSYEQVILPYLKYRGITKVDYLILSHPDADHADGMIRLAREEGMEIKTLLAADQAAHQTDKMGELVMAVKAKGAEVKYVQAGDQFDLSGAAVTVLSPDRAYANTNAGSLCLVIVLEGYPFLFTGDMDTTAEKTVVEAQGGAMAPVNILKVAHHGSETSSSEAFLQMVHPTLAVVSCGRNNPYGHPAKEVIQRFSSLGIPVKVTKDCGAVWLRGYGRKIRYYSFLP